MVSKCANPECSAKFRYLRQGQLFQIESRAPPELEAGAGGRRSPLQFFWLCDECAAEMTLVFRKDSGVVTQPLIRARGTES